MSASQNDINHCRIDQTSRILIVDDDESFITQVKMRTEDVCGDRIKINSIIPAHGMDIFSALRSSITDSFNTEHPFDVVLIDQNIPGFKGLDVLETVRELKASFAPARFLPVVMMTASPEEAQSFEARQLGAFRFMHKSGSGPRPSGGSGIFLQEILLSLPELRAQSEDQMWMTFIQETTQRLNAPDDIGSALGAAADYLKQYLATEATYVRVKDEDHLTLFGGNDIFGAGDQIDLSTVPFLHSLMENDGPPFFLHETLADSDLGGLSSVIRNRLIGMHAAAVPITGGSQRLGTIALYRSAKSHAFREQDIHNLHHFALLISARLNRDDERKRLRGRQQRLAVFIGAIAEATDEAGLLAQLLDLVHGEFHSDAPERSKTTVRLIIPGTTRIPRLENGWRGLQPLNDLEDLCFDTEGTPKDSVYARVIRAGQSANIANVKAPGLSLPYRPCHPDIHSELTVPLLSGGCCLGAINLEHVSPNHYDESDQKFVEAVANIAANGLINIRAKQFFSKILDLVDHLVNPATVVDAQQMLLDAFAALHCFVGYSFLHYLKPAASDTDTWKIERAFGAKGNDVSAEEFTNWRNHIATKWDQTFARKTLNTEGRFTNNKEEIAQDDKISNHQSIMVLHLHGGRNEVIGMLALIFHHSLSLNLYQRSVLEVFGHFLGSLLQAGQNIKTLFDERTVDGQMAVLGLALGQLRHRLRNELGGIGNALNDARRQGMTGPWAEEIRDTLDNVEAELDSSRYFIKPFEPKLFSVSDVWMRVKTVCAGRAKLKNVSILPFGGPQDLGWYSDPDIVALILENLVQNATEAFSDQTNPQVWLEVEPREDGCGLTVRDNGPGIPIVNQSKLFNLGFTTRSTGTGFALYFSRRRARDLGGDLFFVAQDGPGAAFTLKLPPKTGGNGQ